MRLRVISSVLLTMLLFLSDRALAEDTLKGSAKSPALAATLGGLVGFGTGHYYALDSWTYKSTAFAAADTLGASLFVYTAIKYSQGHTQVWFVRVAYLTMAVVGVRIFEGINAYQSAEGGVSTQADFLRSNSANENSLAFEIPIARVRF